MRIDIENNGIVHRLDDGAVAIFRPCRNGGRPEEIEVDRKVADTYNFATGDVVTGDTAQIETDGPAPGAQGNSACWVAAAGGRDDPDDYDERDEPAAARGELVPSWLVRRILPIRRLVGVNRVNGLDIADAAARPMPRLKRHASERIAPERRFVLSSSPSDVTGRTLDFVAPLGMGYAGIIYGPHGAGLTRTLRAAVQGITTNAPDCQVIVLLVRSRGEEITDWRRRFPSADIVACPSPQSDASADETLHI